MGELMMNQQKKGAASKLSAQMIELEVVQGAVASLLERIDDIVHKGWDKDGSMARLSIGEIRDTLRLIDMGFRPLFNEMEEAVNTLQKTDNVNEPDETKHTITRKL